MIEPDAPAPVEIRALSAAEVDTRMAELADILVDAVASGASVNFLAGFDAIDAGQFWRGQLAGIADGSRILIAAGAGARLVGTIVLTFAPQPNAPHRAEIGKMLVHSSAQRRGLGRRLLEVAEAEARRRGRTLLLLDTERESSGEKLYRACGWTEIGKIEGYHYSPDGRLSDTVLFRKTVS